MNLLKSISFIASIALLIICNSVQIGAQENDDLVEALLIGFSISNYPVKVVGSSFVHEFTKNESQYTMVESNRHGKVTSKYNIFVTNEKVELIKSYGVIDSEMRYVYEPKGKLVCKITTNELFTEICNVLYMEEGINLSFTIYTIEGIKKLEYKVVKISDAVYSLNKDGLVSKLQIQFEGGVAGRISQMCIIDEKGKEEKYNYYY